MPDYKSINLLLCIESLFFNCFFHSYWSFYFSTLILGLLASLPSSQGTVAFANITISTNANIATIITFTIILTVITIISINSFYYLLKFFTFRLYNAVTFNHHLIGELVGDILFSTLECYKI